MPTMNSYLWLKAFHQIAMVAWFSGLFYLPRLFVYHTEVSPADQQSYDRFCTMEYKLYNYITTPAAVVTTVFGLWLLFSYSIAMYKTAGWLHAKFALIVLLFVYHIYTGLIVKKFRNRENLKSNKYYRVYNEIPTVFLICIIILVVVKPF